MKLNIYDSVDEVLEAVASYFIECAANAIRSRNRFVVSLSGGTSPKNLYTMLASDSNRDKIAWDKVYFFFGDERNVPADHPESNYLMVKKVLFEPLAISDSQVFPVNTTLPPVEAASGYTADIANFFQGEEQRFDLILLGLGDDAHTASLFPYTTVLHEGEARIQPVFLPKQQVYRITFTAPLINQAENVAFLVYGESKAQAVWQVLEGEPDTQKYPAKLIQPTSGKTEWFLDKAAAKKIGHSNN